MTYNDVFLRAALLNDIASLKLPTKATAERLILKAHYARAIADFELMRSDIGNDNSSDEEQKNAAIKAVAAKETDTADKRFTYEAFEQIVAAVIENATIKTLLRNNEDVDVNSWLSVVAEALVLS